MASLCSKFFLWVALNLFLFESAQAQTSFDSLFHSPSRFIPFKEKITDIECDEEGNIYLLESERHRLHKRFLKNNYDSVLTVGGKGSGEEGFNFPVKICVPNRQNLFLLDLMNRRVAVLNTNLRVVEDINFLDIDLNLLDESNEYLNPLSFAASSIGELYILNQEDLKIYKVASRGRLQTVFGGLDYGDGSLVTPDDLVINRDNFIFVADSSRQVVSVFDLFGVFRYKIESPSSQFRWKRIVAYEDYLIFLDDSRLVFLNLLTQKKHEVILTGNFRTIDIAGTRTHFFLLTSGGIEIYRF
jgi:hypothetical protein